MENSLLQPLIKQLESNGETRDLALARVLEFSYTATRTLEDMNNRLEVVEKQTILTNGRVNKMEDSIDKVETQLTDDYGVIHSPFAKPMSDLQKEVGSISSSINTGRNICIAAVSAVTTLFVVFGLSWWERIMFWSTLTEDSFKSKIVDIIKLQVP